MAWHPVVGGVMVAYPAHRATFQVGYLGAILDPMHSARVHGAFSSTVEATTSPRVLSSCSTVTTMVGRRQ
jgi:hypothetical protein